MLFRSYDWEVPATINDTWGFKSDDHNWKSVDDLLRKLVEVASKDGNYLLNVGPTAEGVIPEASVERLEAIGRWLAINGESIYGTRGGDLQGLDGLRATQKGETLYVHVLDWPTDGQVRLPARISGARLLVDGSPLAVRSSGDGSTVHVPAQPPDPIDTVIACSLAG